MFPKFILFFVYITLGLFISSCAGLIDQSNQAPVQDVSVSGGSSVRNYADYSQRVNISTQKRRLNSMKPNLANPKNKNWVAPANETARLTKRYSQNQPRISYQGDAGSEVYAASSGRVEFSGEVQNLGLIIIVRHSNQYASIYVNNYRNLVQTNDTVEKGQLIAQMGMDPQDPSKGLLNFELRRSNKNVNPHRYF